MKNLFTLALLFLIAGWAGAQPVISDLYFPQAGKTLGGRSFQKTVPLPAISQGANQTWNLAGLDSVFILDYNFVFRHKAPQNMDSLALFPGSTSGYVSWFGTDSVENFHKIEGQDLYYQGNSLRGAPISERFSIPRLELRTNQGFEETIRRTSESTSYSGSNLRYNRYRDTLTYAGYGTLVTPFGTYNDAILLTRFYSIEFSSSPNGPFEFFYLGKEWLWYLPGYGLPFVKYNEDVNLLVPDEIRIEGYVGFQLPVANQNRMEETSFQLLPNRTRAGGRIRVSKTGSETCVAFLSNGAGQIFSVAVENGEVRIPAISPGLYHIRIQQPEAAPKQGRLVIE